MPSERYYRNILVPRDLTVDESALIASSINKYSSICKRNINNIPTKHIYTGQSGIVLMLFQIGELHRAFEDSDFSTEQHFVGEFKSRYCYDEASIAMHNGDAILKRSGATFLEGEVGCICLEIVLKNRLQEQYSNYDSPTFPIESGGDFKHEPEEYELLYGKAGFLSSVLFLRHYLERPNLLRSQCIGTIKKIIKVGIANSEKYNQPLPLFYFWHGKAYLGAAHGIVGILSILVQFESLFPIVEKELNMENNSIKSLISETTNILLSYIDKNGFFPASIESMNDKRLTHWCHGAPGIALYLCILMKSQSIYCDRETCKNVLHLLGNHIWEKGLLKKGLGLCHGIGGNGLILLCIGHATGEKEWIQKAFQFALFGIQRYSELVHVPDNPYSMFEGLAGFVWFLCCCLRYEVAQHFHLKNRSCLPSFPGMYHP